MLAYFKILHFKRTQLVGTSDGASELKIVGGDSLSFSEQLNLNGSGCPPHTLYHTALQTKLPRILAHFKRTFKLKLVGTSVGA